MTAGGSGREGGRALKTRVKTSHQRSLSSTLWLERQLNDPYVAQAKRDGYRSRAAYKLLEMSEKYKLFKPGGRIVFVEFRKEDPTVPIKELHKMSEAQVRKEMAVQPELEFSESIETLPRQHILIFKKK